MFILFSGFSLHKLAKFALWILLFSSYAVAATPLQDAVDRAFAGQQGAAVIVRVADNQVLAAHNLPVLTRRVAAPGSADREMEGFEHVHQARRVGAAIHGTGLQPSLGPSAG